MNQGISTFHVSEPDVRDDNLLRNNTPETVNKWPNWVRSNFKTISFKDIILKKQNYSLLEAGIPRRGQCSDFLKVKI